jgi:hypothetical protein
MGNPVRYIDPTGEFVPLVPFLLTVGGGALVGGGVDLALQFGINWIKGKDVFDQNCSDLDSVVYNAMIGGAQRGLWGKFEDLTIDELFEIQRFVNRAGRPLDVVGSGARGARRGIGTGRPIGEGPGTRSDTDFMAPESHHPYFDAPHSLPNAGNPPRLPGAPNPHIGPSIRFEPTG